MNEEPLPWYRQFWLWFLIALPTIVILACLYTIWLALGSPLSLVKKDYYQEGLTINKNQAELQRAQDLGLSMQVEFTATGEALSVHLDSRQQARDVGDTLSLEFNHPLDASKDKRILLEMITPGEYRAVMTPAETAALQAETRWYLYLKGNLPDGTAWTLQSEWPTSSHD